MNIVLSLLTDPDLRCLASASSRNFCTASRTVILTSDRSSIRPRDSQTRTLSWAASQLVRSKLFLTGSPASVPATQRGHLHRRCFLDLYGQAFRWRLYTVSMTHCNMERYVLGTQESIVLQTIEIDKFDWRRRMGIEPTYRNRVATHRF